LVLIGEEPTASTGWVPRRGSRGRRSRVEVVLRPDWVYRVLERGLAVIDGKMVLDLVAAADVPQPGVLISLGRPVPIPSWFAALGKKPDLTQGPLALAVYPGTGCSVYAQPARVVNEVGPGGKPRTVLRPLAGPGR
jgi:hypothetical protein